MKTMIATLTILLIGISTFAKQELQIVNSERIDSDNIHLKIDPIRNGKGHLNIRSCPKSIKRASKKPYGKSMRPNGSGL